MSRVHPKGALLALLGLAACAGPDGPPTQADDLLCGANTPTGERYHPDVLNAEISDDPRIMEQTSIESVSTCEQARAVREAQAALSDLETEPARDRAGASSDDDTAAPVAKILDGSPSYDRSTVMLRWGTYSCSAVHIRPDVLLTAAHCLPSSVSGSITGSPLWLTITRRLPSGVNSASFQQTLAFRHPSYSGSNDPGDDIGIIVLPTALRGASRPIWLGTLSRGNHLYIHGWGVSTNVGDETSGELRQGKDGAPISVSRTRKNYFRSRGRKARICDGDSGGPAFRLTDGQTFLAGIASSSRGPGGCTKEHRAQQWHRVQGHMSWIEERIGPCQRMRTSQGQLYAQCY